MTTIQLNVIRKTTHELKDGDVIKNHGSIFRLKNRKVWPMEADFCPKLQGECITFDTDLLVYSAEPGGMPYEWAQRWIIQGNKLAVWAVLVDPESFQG